MQSQGTHPFVFWEDGVDFFSFTLNVLFLYKIEINLKIIIYTFWENADISSKMYFFSKRKELLQELFPFSVIF